MSATERALSSTDILQEIFEHLGYDPTEDKYPGSVAFDSQALGARWEDAALAACARVSRRFSPLALDVLWRVMDDLVDLFAPLPSFQPLRLETNNRPQYVSVCRPKIQH